MREEFEDAKSELKRVDHLIYVSLKYTRTVDVFKSIIERLINSYGFLIEGILASLKDRKKIANYAFKGILGTRQTGPLTPALLTFLNTSITNIVW